MEQTPDEADTDATSTVAASTLRSESGDADEGDHIQSNNPLSIADVIQCSSAAYFQCIHVNQLMWCRDS
jgi:hypothetical protein